MISALPTRECLFRVFRLVRHLFRAAFRVRPGAHFFARVHLSVGIHVISTHELLQAYRFGRLAGTVGCALRADAGSSLVDTVETSAGSVEAGGALFQVLLGAELQLASASEVERADQVGVTSWKEKKDKRIWDCSYLWVSRLCAHKWKMAKERTQVDEQSTHQNQQLTLIEPQSSHHTAQMEVVLGVLTCTHTDNVLQSIQHCQFQRVHAAQVKTGVHLRKILLKSAK